METYVIMRRDGWRTPDELQQAAARSTAEGDRMPGRHPLDPQLRAGGGGRRARHRLHLPGVGPDAIRAHAYRAGLPVDEIVAVADTVIVRPDPAPTAA